MHAHTPAQVIIPKNYAEYTRRRVHVAEWVEGEKLSQSDADNVGELVNLGVIVYLTQLLDTGFFHADPHPGNIMLVGDELKPGLIDFGQCTTLTKPQLRTVCQLVVLLRTRSQTLIDQALRGSGFGFNTEDPELKLALSYLRVLKC